MGHGSRVLGLAVACTLAVPLPAMAQELKPLDVVIDSFKSSGDLAHAAYLFQRCAGLYLALSWLRRSAGNDPTGAEKFQEHAEKLMMLTIETETETEIAKQKSGDDPVAIAKSLQERDYGKAVVATANLYMDRMKKNYLLTGLYFAEDPGIQREMQICESPSVVLRKALESPRGRR